MAGGARRVLALLLALSCSAGSAAASLGVDRVQGYFGTPDFDGGGTGEVTVEIKQGDADADIANTLFEAGVVKSAKAFVEAAEAQPAQQNIQPGIYKLRKQMSGDDALAGCSTGRAGSSTG